MTSTSHSNAGSDISPIKTVSKVAYRTNVEAKFTKLANPSSDEKSDVSPVKGCSTSHWPSKKDQDLAGGFLS